MKDNHTILIQITPAQLDEIIERNVRNTVSKLNKLPRYVTADVLAQHFEVTKGRTINPATLRKWPILKPFRRKIHGKVFFDAHGSFEAIENQKDYQGIIIKNIS